MKCPFCLGDNTDVLESRVSEGGMALRRRRLCTNCEKRFTTYERAEGADIDIVKKNGSIEKFDREKVRKGILKATWKRPVTLEQIDELLDQVECVLRSKRVGHVKSWEIGQLVIERLQKIDALACLLFSSVYRDFRTLEEFESAIRELRSQPLQVE